VPEKSTRADVLNEASEAIHGDRNTHYGTPMENFDRIAQYWTIYLANRRLKKIKPGDVANMMILLKIARGMNLPTKDTYVDIAGYAACGWETMEQRGA